MRRSEKSVRYDRRARECAGANFPTAIMEELRGEANGRKSCIPGMISAPRSRAMSAAFEGANTGAGRQRGNEQGMLRTEITESIAGEALK